MKSNHELVSELCSLNQNVTSTGRNTKSNRRNSRIHENALNRYSEALSKNSEQLHKIESQLMMAHKIIIDLTQKILNDKNFRLSNYWSNIRFIPELEWFNNIRLVKKENFRFDYQIEYHPLKSGTISTPSLSLFDERTDKIISVNPIFYCGDMGKIYQYVRKLLYNQRIYLLNSEIDRIDEYCEKYSEQMTCCDREKAKEKRDYLNRLLSSQIRKYGILTSKRI